MIKKLIFLIISSVIIFYIHTRVDERFFFFADNSTKYYQAVAVIHNQFRDDVIRCQWISGFENCRFHPVTNTMMYISKEKIMGVFPIALSYINALLIKFLSYKILLWLPLILVVLMVFILYQIGYLNFITSLLLFLATPLLGTSIMYFDVILHLFFVVIYYLYLKKVREKEVGFIMILLLGILSGFNFFFRYEGEIYLIISLALLILFEKRI